MVGFDERGDEVFKMARVSGYRKIYQNGERLKLIGNGYGEGQMEQSVEDEMFSLW